MMKRSILLLAMMMFAAVSATAQTYEEMVETLFKQVPVPENVGDMKAVFRFAEDQTDVILGYGDNQAAMDTICMVMNPSIVEPGTVLVEGYGDNDALVRLRCMKVKSELITLIGMKDKNFKTSWRKGTYQGRTNVVVVTVPENVMASAMRDLEIMRILSTPHMIEVVEETYDEQPEVISIPFMAEQEDPQQEEQIEQVQEQPRRPAKLHYAKPLSRKELRKAMKARRQ
ncbi:MAG: hypothetical protein J6K90_03805 [Tidjanibacter sp.]|nr:hypothetical protein [Tidjanibacter sp.]MBR6831242.1 hypothetical protein [Tidjanibacter sp.]